MNLKPNVLIFSVFQKTVAKHVNEMAHLQLFSALKSEGLPVLELKGKYEGSDELSILIEGFQYRDYVERICKIFNQECYLESHNDRTTFLVYPDGRSVNIGTLTPVSKSEAMEKGSYSFSEAVGQYYVLLNNSFEKCFLRRA